MRNRLIGSMIVLLPAITFLSFRLLAQPGQRGAGRGNAATAGPPVPHDPHDLNGVWLAQGGGGRGGRGNGATEADAKGFLKDGGIMTQWGRGYVRGGHRRSRRESVARRMGRSVYRPTALDGAMETPGPRSSGARTEYQRSRHVHQAMDHESQDLQASTEGKRQWRNARGHLCTRR